MKPTPLRCLLSCCIVSSVLVAPVFGAHADEAVVLHPLKGLGVDEETVANLESIVHNELARVPGLRLIEAQRTRQLMGEHGVDCDGADECLADLARRLEAQVAVYGVVGGLGESYTIALKAVDAETAEARSRVDLRVGGEREVLIDGVRAGAFQLLRPDLYAGSLQLDMPEEGAEVYVDGELVGVTPLAEPVTGIEPGQRALKIVMTGFRDFDRFIEIRFQRTSVVTIDLERSAVAGVIYEEAPVEEDAGDDPEALALHSDLDGVVDGHDEEDSGEPSTPMGPAELGSRERAGPGPLRLAAYGLLGGGGAALAAGGHQGFSAQRQESSLSRVFSDQGGPVEDDVDAWERAHATADRANLLYMVGGAVTAAGAAMLVADTLRARSRAMPAPDASELLVLPVAHDGGLGLTLSRRW